MGALLVGTDGPSRGRLVPLGTTEVSVGRDESNSVAIDDAAASRRHFIVRPAGERFQLIDLESRNGTFVNGALVRERLLEDNDEIRVGGSVFLFRKREKEPARVDGILTNSATLLRSGDSIFLNPRKLEETLIADRTAHGVHVLLRISQTLQGAPTLAALQQQLLELLLEAVPADRGTIVLSSAEVDSSFGWERGVGHQDSAQIPPEVLKKVLEERTAIMDANATRRMLAAPLVCFSKVEGLLYLDGSPRAGAFDKGHLELVSAVGAIAGLAIHNLLRVEELRNENQRLEEEIRIQHDMVGDSGPMREVHRFIARVAATNSTVLIGGESGTGKELVARALHQNSDRAGHPFVAINCAALTESLLESELFGHERGAFTGAIGTKKGKFEVAHGGTLFLDEIGELAPSLQAKLLRVLQQQEFERVGGTRPIHIDVRIVAATNRDLEAAAKNGTFRQDLYFRLNVISLTMPPLRERREDIPLLAAYFAEKFSQKLKRRVTGIAEKTRTALLRYDWPGNVRELENAIERAVVLGTADAILPEDLPENVLESIAPASSAGPPSGMLSYQDAVVEAKRRVVRDALDRARGVYTEAARLLDVHPNYLHRLVRNLRLR